MAEKPRDKDDRRSAARSSDSVHWARQAGRDWNRGFVVALLVDFLFLFFFVFLSFG